VAPLEPWEKVLVNGEEFIVTVHGQIECTECHGGIQDPDKEVAHEGIVGSPSEDPDNFCADCHPKVVAMGENSLHNNLTGYWYAIDARRSPNSHDELSEMFGNHCASCHTTCGDCHVSQPGTVGGGLVDGHLFNATPSMTQNCTACHGSRVGNEYLGKHEDIKADVHFRQGRMSCVDCHTDHEMHGQPAQCQECHPGPETEMVPPPEHRYAGTQTPRCDTCHASVSTGEDGFFMHQMHGSDLACQVCHSEAYTSCDGCHVALSETTGNPFFETDGSYLTFFIGNNPFPSYQRPYKYVPVRHVPISRDSYAYYGDDLLSNFDDLETWKYTTPHNIQRITPQAQSCNACHGNKDIFLTADKVSPDEVEANLGVIVEEIPPEITAESQLP
jgi:thiosulfate/3-mercaptopyruvate sulfurtransferase